MNNTGMTGSNEREPVTTFIVGYPRISTDERGQLESLLTKGHPNRVVSFISGRSLSLHHTRSSVEMEMSLLCTLAAGNELSEEMLDDAREAACEYERWLNRHPDEEETEPGGDIELAVCLPYLSVSECASIEEILRPKNEHRTVAEIVAFFFCHRIYSESDVQLRVDALNNAVNGLALTDAQKEAVNIDLINLGRWLADERNGFGEEDE